MGIYEEAGYLLLGWSLWILGLSEEDVYFCQVRSFGSWAGLGQIVLFYLVKIGFRGTGCIIGGLLGFPLEESMGSTKVEEVAECWIGIEYLTLEVKWLDCIGQLRFAWIN